MFFFSVHTYMTSKRQLLESKLDEMERFYVEEKLPFYDKLQEERKKMNLEQITGLIVRFLLPASSCLEEYLLSELCKLEMLLAMDEKYSDVCLDLTEKQKNTVVEFMQSLINIIKK